MEDTPEGMLETCRSNLEVLEDGVNETSMTCWSTLEDSLDAILTNRWT